MTARHLRRMRASLATPRYAFTRLGGLAWAGIAATIYITLGFVAQRTGERAELALLLAGVFVALTALTYTELTGLHDARGRRVARPPGAAAFVRVAFNEPLGFVTGWAVVLDLFLVIALAAEAAGEHAAIVLAAIGVGGDPAVLVAIAVIVGVAVRNARVEVLGSGISARLWLVLDAAALAVLGALLLIQGARGAAEAPVPSADAASVLVAATFGLIALTGFETAASLTAETYTPPARRRRVRRSLVAAFVLVLAAAGLVASAHVGVLASGGAAPVVALAGELEPHALGESARIVVALLATGTLVIVAGGAMLAVSRLSSTMARQRQIPAGLGRLSSRHGTPVLIITAAAVAAALAVATLGLAQLVGLYAFGALLATTLVHAALLRLRWVQPQLERRYRVPFAIAVGGHELPLPAAVAAIGGALAWFAVIAGHEGAALLGGGWMLAGAVVFLLTRRRAGLGVGESISVPADALVRERDRGEFGSVLVPVFGHALDDDIVQTAGRLARDRAVSRSARGAQIDVIWVVAVPMSLELDAPLPHAVLERADAVLARARAVGEEYEGVRVDTTVVRARLIGQGIVEEAHRRAAEAIVMGPEEHAPGRAGALLGGRVTGTRPAVGPITSHVLQHATCRVVVTAPPAGAPE